MSRSRPPLRKHSHFTADCAGLKEAGGAEQDIQTIDIIMITATIIISSIAITSSPATATAAIVISCSPTGPPHQPQV